MDRVWIVMGSTGEYSDRTDWPVVAFASEAEAKERIAALDVRMQKIKQEWRDAPWECEDEIKAHMAPLDPYFSSGYTGTSYFFYEVELAQPDDQTGANAGSNIESASA